MNLDDVDGKLPPSSPEMKVVSTVSSTASYMFDPNKRTAMTPTSAVMAAAIDDALSPTVSPGSDVIVISTHHSASAADVIVVIDEKL